MKERPIIFSGPMVLAILDGRKTQTRRVMRTQPQTVTEKTIEPYPAEHAKGLLRQLYAQGRYCPYGVPGDRLWVREAGAHVPKTAYAAPLSKRNPIDADMAWVYKATFDRSPGGFRWRPSIHMPRWASRIALEIVNVRVERVQEITYADAIDEGWHPACGQGADTWFSYLWDSINAKRGYPWDSNPWVWRIEFRHIREEREG